MLPRFGPNRKDASARMHCAGLANLLSASFARETLVAHIATAILSKVVKGT